ncbi:carbonic anhydrase IV c [Chanos chanos]|uniref:Carbonic anhydrase n=1 Tax=Chanos chanos TaxID=29144 RepID=A0A6J2W3V1_CHACN|nr:carbonic anhydrase 4-like [Chanos chanos]
MRSLLHCFSLLPLLYLCSAQWCYQSQYSCDQTCREPSHWYVEFSMCGGRRQSPINIVTHKVQSNISLGPFIFEGHTDTLNITVENMGHSAHFDLPPTVRVSGGGLQSRYKAVQFHFHWGENAGPGSEHTVDGERYPMELHIVHIKEKYSSLEEAEKDPEGIALLAFFFEESSKQNEHFNALIEALGRVRYHGNTSSIPVFRMSDLIPAANELSSYYRYIGSMTTPGCDEAVIWTVFRQTLPISHKQLVKVSQQLLFWTGRPMTNIFRPVQNLNGRTVSGTNSVVNAF